jgi:17beta-estradiol 17-dehydrogenase / very-long-chain 3-oxoacyl-CoA reductase
LIRKYPAIGGNQTRPWALITGASDGIGAEYSRQLARMGFNICLVSRTLSKMQAVVDDIKNAFPEVFTKVIVADFSAPDATNIDFF